MVQIDPCCQRRRGADQDPRGAGNLRVCSAFFRDYVPTDRKHTHLCRFWCMRFRDVSRLEFARRLAEHRIHFRYVAIKRGLGGLPDVLVRSCVRFWPKTSSDVVKAYRRAGSAFVKFLPLLGQLSAYECLEFHGSAVLHREPHQPTVQTSDARGTPTLKFVTRSH